MMMITLLRAELLKLYWTRATWGFLAAASLIVVLRVELILAGVTRVGSASPGSTELTLAVLGASGAGVPVIALLGVVVVSREFHSKTWTATLLVTPNRARVLAAKFLAAGILGVLVAALLFAVALVLGVASGAVSLVVTGSLAQMIAGGLLSAACWGWFGAAIGALVRNQTVALLVPPIWLLLVETLLPPYGLREVVPFTPGGASTALAGGDLVGALPGWAAGALLLGYGLVLSLPAVRLARRADVC